MILNSLLPRKEMLTPCFKGLILLTTGNVFFPWAIFDSDRIWVSLPAPLALKDLSIPILNLLRLSVFCFLPLSPDLLRDPSVPHTGITMQADHRGWKLRRAGPELFWTAPHLGFDLSLRGSELQFQFNINSGNRFIYPWKHLEINTNPTKRTKLEVGVWLMRCFHICFQNIKATL